MCKGKGGFGTLSTHSLTSSSSVAVWEGKRFSTLVVTRIHDIECTSFDRKGNVLNLYGKHFKFFFFSGLESALTAATGCGGGGGGPAAAGSGSGGSGRGSRGSRRPADRRDHGGWPPPPSAAAPLPAAAAAAAAPSPHEAGEHYQAPPRLQHPLPLPGPRPKEHVRGE